MIAGCRSQKQDVRVLVLTDGSRSHPRSNEYPPARLAELRRAEARAAVAELGIEADHIGFLGLQDGNAPLRGPHVRAVATEVAHFAKHYGVRTILTTWRHDPHRDHLAAYRIGTLAARMIGANLFCYPVWGWTLPASSWLHTSRISGVRIDITRQLPAKRRAIERHRSQVSGLIRDDPTGFRATPEFLANFDRPFEFFLDG